MLYLVLQYLNLYIAQFLPSGVTVELAPVPSREQMAGGNGTRKLLYISLLNVEEDKVLKPPYRYQRNTTTDPATNYLLNPEMRFYLYIMFTGFSDDYTTSLKSVSAVINAFANKNFFEGADLTAAWATGSSDDFSDAFSQLALDLYTQSLDQSNSMWQAISSNILPNVIYKVRLMSIVPTLNIGQVGEVRDVNINTVTSN